MDERKAPGYYGMRIGLLSGAFSILQVLIAAAALNAARAAVSAYYDAGVSAYNSTDTKIGAIALINPSTALTQPIPTLTAEFGGLLFTTILSTVVLGIVTLVFAWYAGRLTAMAIGRHKGGASAGSTVWWVSSLIWIVASLVSAAITSPNNLIDIPTSYISATYGYGFNTNFFPLGFITLLILDGLVALIGWGLCAAAGAMGASTAPRDVSVATFAPGMMGAPLGMPPMALAGYPPAPNYPPLGFPQYPPQAFAPPPAGVYPPPPGYYAPPQMGQAAPRPPSTTPDSAPSATTGDDR